MTNILVTGGAGYIGSHTCKALYQSGFTPVTYDSLEHGHEWAVKWGPFLHGDICDEQRLDEVFAHYQPAAVIHFAAYAYVGESMGQPERYYDNNVGGSLSLLKVMRRHGCRRIVFSSTCATYGHPPRVPIREDTPQQPINPYGMTKLAVEQMLVSFSIAHAFGAISLRYFNAAGADPEGQVGEAHEPEPHLIPRILDVAAGRETAMRIYGTDYDTPDGTCIRDYIHVTDLASAHVLSAQALLDGAGSDVYNLGTGRGVSVLEMLATAEQVTGQAIARQNQPRRPGDPPELVAASDKARSILGWEPKWSDPRQVLETAWRWHQQHHDLG